jgi:hypothetical protein
MAHKEKKEMVHHPAHYGGRDNPYEVVKVLEAWDLEDDALLWNAVKYIARKPKDDEYETRLEDLKKAEWYLHRRIKNYGKKRSE